LSQIAEQPMGADANGQWSYFISLNHQSPFKAIS